MTENIASLLQILRSDSAVDVKVKALTSLANFGTEEEKRQEILAHDGVEIISSFLKRKDIPKAQMRACVCVLNICVHPEIKQKLCDSGAIEALLALLDEYDHIPQTTQYAVGALNNLANDFTCQRYIVEKGGLEATVKLLNQCKPDDVVTKQYAVGVLGSISIIPEVGHDLFEKYGGLNIIHRLLDEHADDLELVQRSTGVLWNVAISEQNRKLYDQQIVERLLGLLKFPDREVICNSLVVLGMLSMDSDVGTAIINNSENALESAISLLNEYESSDDEELKGFGLMFIGNLCQCDPNSRDRVRELGALPLIARQLDTSVADTLGKAVGCILALAINQNNAQLFATGAEENVLERLISLLLLEYGEEDSETLDIIRVATTSLGTIAYFDNTKDAIVEKGGVDTLIELLTKTVRPDGEIAFGDEELLEKITGFALNMSSDQNVRNLFKKLNGIQPLIDLLDHEQEEIRNNAAGALCNLSIDASIKTLIKKLGGLRRLLSIMQENLNGETSTVTKVIRKDKAKPVKTQIVRQTKSPDVNNQSPQKQKVELTEEEKKPEVVSIPRTGGPPKKRTIKMVADDVELFDNTNITPVTPVQRATSSTPTSKPQTPQQDLISPDSIRNINVDTISDEEVMTQFEKMQQKSVGSWIQSKMNSVLENAGKSKATFGRVVEPLPVEEYEKNPDQPLPLAALQTGRKFPSWVDPACRERYLSDRDFVQVFNGITRDTFEQYPDWKKMQLKKSVGLF
jgi:hypothetical protein